MSRDTSTLTATKFYRDVCANLFSSQANGVRAPCWIVDGGAGGLGHGPFVPHFLPVVAAPESHRDIFISGYGDGLLLEERKREINVPYYSLLSWFSH